MKPKVLRRQTIAKGFVNLDSVTFAKCRFDGTPEELEREIVDAGDAVVVLPYDPERGTIILIRQFRGVAFLKDGGDGVIIEAIAGKLDGLEPEAAARKETEEEVGVRLSQPPRRIFDAYSSPGSFCEKLTFFVAPYGPEDRISAGGGCAHENEDIDVLETTLDAALAMVSRGEIVDAKTLLMLFYAQATGLMRTA